MNPGREEGVPRRRTGRWPGLQEDEPGEEGGFRGGGQQDDRGLQEGEREGFQEVCLFLNLSLTKSTLRLKSTLLFVDRPDTYTILDFISYLCEFGFYKFCLTGIFVI